MPWGISVIAVMSVLLLFDVGEQTVKRLALNKTLGILLLLITAVGLLVPDITAGNQLIINLGGFVFPLIIAVYIFLKATPKEIGRGILCAVAVCLIMLGASYFISPIPTGIISEPGLLYGIIAGITAFIAGFNTVSALGGLLWGLLLWDVSLGLIYRFYYTLNIPVELGMYSFGDTLALSFLICAFLSSLVSERVSQGKARLSSKSLSRSSQKKESNPLTSPQKIKLFKKSALFEIGDIERKGDLPPQAHTPLNISQNGAIHEKNTD